MTNREMEIEQVIQNMEIMLNNQLPPEVSANALEAFHEARFILQVELLRIFKASLKPISRKDNGIIGKAYIRESLITSLHCELETLHDANTRMQSAEEKIAQLLKFSSGSYETEKNQSTN